MKHLVFFLEEPSAREMLKGLVPKLISKDVVVRYIVFEGKQDLEKQLSKRIRGWMTPESGFVVMRDQDAGECIAIKNKLQTICQEAGKPRAIVRIACRELESWYFGDLAAVEAGLGLQNLTRHARSKKYRSPDHIVSPSRELGKVTQNAYRKVAGSRAIGPHMQTSPQKNTSVSFNYFIEGISKALDAAT